MAALQGHGRTAALGWRPSPEMLADFACVLAAWAVAYVLRLGVARMYVVTWVPEVLFIVTCALATVAFLKFRGQYFSYRTRFHKGDAKRILVATLVVGFGFSAVARFFDVEIISRTAIVLAPPLSAVLMINWRLAMDHFSARAAVPAQSDARAVAAGGRKAVMVVNSTELDVSPICTYWADAEADFDLIVYGAKASLPELPARARAGHRRLRIVEDVERSYAEISLVPEAVIALPREWTAAWQADARYRAQPGHRFVTIESLALRAREFALGGQAGL